MAKRMHEYRQAMLEAGDVETLQGIVRKIGELALAGDMTAAKEAVGNNLNVSLPR